MTYKVILTKSFSGDLKKLLAHGHKKTVQAVRAAMTEAGTSGEINSIPRTKHGESRVPDVEKYDLPDAFRLVVQLVDGTEKTRAFLFVGNHADAEHWLDTHRNYSWVKSGTDGTLNFVLVTVAENHRHVPADRLDLESPDELLELPLLRFLSEGEWLRIGLPASARQIASTVSGSDFQQDADGILEKLDLVAGYTQASLLFDLMWHAHTKEWAELHRRVELLDGSSAVSAATEAAVAMSAIENSESFITFDDKELLDEFFSKHTLADWMLFLHPDQKTIAYRDLRGPARLRGISGSGKTCVLVHRARYLAKKYREPILLVTLTESMRKLLDRLADDMCGVERSLITTKTMSMLAKDILHESHLGKAALPPSIPAERQVQFVEAAAAYVRKHSEVEQTPFHSMDQADLQIFMRDEISYVRGRLREADFNSYIDAHAFQRRGRGIPLNQISRRVALSGIKHYVEILQASKLIDHEGLVSSVLSVLDKSPSGNGQFRCVLCDEVQDLSELDVALIGNLKTPNGEGISVAENGLFLAGDGAQSIYKRGFALRRLGIDVLGRSYSLRKNYRNTHEILTAAFGLVSQYEFADVDEENISRPSPPDFAKRHGTRPLLLRCTNLTEEANAIANNVRSLLAMGQTPGQICIIGPSTKTREEVKYALDSLGVQFAELRQDADYESERVKVSTIESAKGHEFGSVFIMGLVEGVLPSIGIALDDLPREAARLYVAMTRARESLVITYSPRPNFAASRFLTAIQRDCDEAFLRDGELRRLSQ
ncbi:3'-5' exonuclease [Trinickia sp.]|uniref:3'-5' exonuclease n=1 Tax=Trinickia sp. TaxID=2571163 RepID=UPI003F7E3D27